MPKAVYPQAPIPCRMRVLLIACLVLATVLAAAPLAEAKPDPLVHTCNDVTDPCWNGSLLCFSFSQQMPTCLPVGR